MPEQIIWIGEKQLVLEPDKPDVEDLAKRQGAMMRFTEMQDRRTVMLPLEAIIEAGSEILAPPSGKNYLDDTYHLFSDIWQKLINQPELPESQAAEKAFKNLKNQVLVELGNGEDPKDFQNFLKAYGPNGYIGIDTINRLRSDRVRRVEDYGNIMYHDTDKGDPLEGALIYGDVLRVISRLPDNSVSLTMNGLDSGFVHMDTPYGQRLMQEIIRVLHPRGIVFGYTPEAGILSELAAQPSIKSIQPTMPEYGIYFMQKTGVK